MKLPPVKIRMLAAALMLIGAAGCQDQPEQPVQPVQPSTDPQVSVQSAPGVMAQPRPAEDAPRVAAASDAAADPHDGPHMAAGASVSYALAELQPVGDSGTTGIVTFMDDMPEGSGIRVLAEFIDLPTGMHGFHIHENGDCSAPDASSAGDHFNPTAAPHAARDAEQRHMGDLGNVEADANNLASLDFHDSKLSFDGPDSIIGKAVIVHAGRDDLMTQPSGDAGDRIACGVIEARDSGDLLPAEE